MLDSGPSTRAIARLSLLLAVLLLIAGCTADRGSTAAWRHTAAGEGWRLVGGGFSREEAYTVRAATDGAAWERMWAEIRPAANRPAVDFAEEIVVSFGHGIGSCRELRLDGVVIDDETVYSLVSDPHAPRACTSDPTISVVFLVALRRDALPEEGFVLRLHEKPVTCDGCGFAEEIRVDLH